MTNPAESTIAIARILFSGVLERHPSLVENLDRVAGLTAEERRRVLFENYRDPTRPVLSRRQRARV